MGPLRVRVEKRSQDIAGADVEMCHSDPSPRQGLLPGPFAPSEFVSTAESRFGQWHIFFGCSQSRDSLKEGPDSLKEKKIYFYPVQNVLLYHLCSSAPQEVGQVVLRALGDKSLRIFLYFLHGL